MPFPISSDFPTWLPIAEAFKICVVRFDGDRQLANDRLLEALREGKIRNGGIMEEWSDRIEYRKIHIYTDDLMKWLDLAAGPAKVQ